MSEFEAGSPPSSVDGALEHLGWRPEEPSVRDVIPPAGRGTNLILEVPPGVAWAGPALAGLLGSLELRGGRVLVLSAPGVEEEWGLLLSVLTAGTPLRVEIARGPARAARALRADQVDILVGTADTLLALHSRSALAPERVSAIVFGWPEAWDGDEATSILLQDLPKEAQRILLTATSDDGSDPAHDLAERYARKALRFPAPGSEPGVAAPPAGAARTVATSWSGRVAAVAGLLERIDPAEVTIWTVDRRDHDLLRTALGGSSAISLAVRSVPERGPVVCYDPPTRSELAGLAAVGEVYLLVPPGVEPWVSRIASPRIPVPGGGALAELQRRDSDARTTLERMIESGDEDGALYALAPLFERYDAQRVAAAAWRLWRGRQPATIAAESTALKTGVPVGGVATAKIWIGVGKKDDAAVGDFVAVLVKEVGLDRAKIGRIELRDTFALVEVPAADAERVVLGLGGVTIRRRRVVARIDRGPGERPANPRGAGRRPPTRSR